jgi:hypothetical protein
MRGDGGNPETRKKSRTSSVDDDHSVCSHTRRERVDIDVRREGQGTACRDVEPGTVPRADGNPLLAVELAFTQRPLVVGALILDGEELAAAVVDPDGKRRGNLHDSNGSRRELGERADIDLWHR